MTAPTMTSQDPAADVLRTALFEGARPAPPSALSVSLTFSWRAMLKLKHVPEQLFDAVGTPIIFTLMFTYLFGNALLGSTTDYLNFVLPGILAYTVLTMTVYTGVNLNSDISRGVSDRFRSLPVWRPAVIVGALLGDIARYVLASSIVLGLGLILGFRPDGGLGGVLLAVGLVLVFAFSVSWIWTSVGLVLRTPMSVQWTATMLMFALTFISNVFVDPETLPSGLETVVQFNPVTHLVTAVRGLMDGTFPGQEIGWLLVACAGLVALFAPLTMRLYRNKI